MRTLLTTATALTVGLVLTAGLRADDDEKNKQSDQPAAVASQPQTVRGTVAGVTVEGETAIDYQTNKAVVLEAAYLTVVGMPRRGQGGQNRGDANTTENAANRDDANRRPGNANRTGRQNVYLVWLSPKTKVCKAKAGGGDKTECALDELEVGDRVEIQMSRRTESGSNNQGTPTESMRKKHGRNRIFVCDASEITILAAPRGNRDSADNAPRDANQDDAPQSDENEDPGQKDKD
jgi:hypothetical protein